MKFLLRAFRLGFLQLRSGQATSLFDNRRLMAYSLFSGLGVVPGRRLALGVPRAFRFLGEDFKAPAINLPGLIPV